MYSDSSIYKNLVKSAMDATILTTHTNPYSLKPRFWDSPNSPKEAMQEIPAFRWTTPIDKIRSQAHISSMTTEESTILSEYNSGMINSAIKRAKSELTEKDILQNVSEIAGECDLRHTKLENLGSVKKLGSLLIDTKSSIKDLSGLERIAGEVFIRAKDVNALSAFLKSTGLNLVQIGGKIIKNF